MTGVTSVSASVENQLVKVEFNSSMTNTETMLSALKKWGNAGGKIVELIQ